MKKTLFVCLVLLVIACAPVKNAPVAPAPEVVQESASGGTVKEFTIEASQFTFSPDIITVNKGDTVKIILVNKDTSHGIAIPDFGVSLKVGAGEQASTEFVADKAGEFTFFCNVFCGDGHKGMKGKLIVK